MNEFINKILYGDKEGEEFYTERRNFQDRILSRDGAIAFLKEIDVTFAVYFDISEEIWQIAIKENPDNCTLFMNFDKFHRFIKIYSSHGENGNAFETWISGVLMNHFYPVQFRYLEIHSGSNTIEMEEKK